MTYDFDQIINRRGTNSLKYDFAKERGRPEGLLPMWVADMDFPTAKEITDCLIQVARHGIFGYTEVKETYFKHLAGWFYSHFNYHIQPEWLIKTPGVVYAIAQAIRAYTSPGDPVLIQSPVYYPFSGCINDNGRTVIQNTLVYQNGRYSIDFDDFENKIKTLNIRLFLLCSPHNPVGRVWTWEEIQKMGEICLKYKCLVFSDEIHCDFVWDGHRHYPFNSVSSDFDRIATVATAPSKTFNLAGLQISNIFIPNQKQRNLFAQEIERTGFSQLNTMGLAASNAAYQFGDKWLTALKKYLTQNLRLVEDFIETNLPDLTLVPTEGTYLLWLDFRNLGLSSKEINDRLIKKAHLWLDDGLIFGPGGEGFQRLNMACPKKTLQEALDRLEKAFSFKKHKIKKT